MQWELVSIVLQRQLMEQKMKQKRQSAGMIQASDIRSASAKNRTSNPNKRELHGINLESANCIYNTLIIGLFNLIGYDGPLQYTMNNDNNPDQVISILSKPEQLEGQLLNKIEIY